MALFPFTLPLILSSITFDLQLTHLKGTPLTIISPTRNISLSIVGHTIVADSIRIAPIQVGQRVSISIECLSDTSVYFGTANNNALVHSPSLCTKSHGIFIDESLLFGCISSLYQADRLLLSKLCGNGTPEQTTTSQPGTLQPIYVAEPLEVNEGGSMPLQWKNVYMLPEHSRLNISNTDILFSVVEGPQHGQLLLDGKRCAAFNYAHLLSRSVVYRHDGSETAHDAFEFQLEINSNSVDFPWLETKTYTMKIRINSVNDAPELVETEAGHLIKISASGSRLLSSAHLLLSDQDDGPDKVRVQVVESRGVHLQIDNKVVSEFTQRQLINRKVEIKDEGIFEKGVLRLVARDADERSKVLTLNTVSTAIEVRMAVNTGIRLLHHSSAPITSQNLSFSVSVPEIPLFYSMVDLPDHGVVECSPEAGHFAVCSQFSQMQIEKGLVRFRHTSSHHPTQDTFSFQVQSGDFVSMIHNFRIMFIPMNVKVFNREVFMLNGTENGFLGRSNLFAWTFPKSFAPDKLIYHIEEPPKYGILSRKIGKKNRRIGVSSNFTQADIDNGLIQYKLHFMQFTIVNDFFLFRVVSPAVSSESLRFEIIFVPSQSSMQLINRTVIVQEGGTTCVTSGSLSLSTSDDKHFVFTVGIAPNQGGLLLEVHGGGKQTLAQGSNFTTSDIEEGRLFYSHSGSESRSDSVYLVAESAFKRGRRIPFWLSFSIILENDNAPHLAGSEVIRMVERGERILYPHLLEWIDEDTDGEQLTFNFNQPIKDAAVLSTVSPYLPVTVFSVSDLADGKIMIRHLGHKINSTIPYTVSDGKYSVKGNIVLIASDPFVRMGEHLIEYCCLPGDTPQLEIGPKNLSVVTNLDVRPTDIQYSSGGRGFWLNSKTGWQPVHRFTQQDINERRVAYRVHGIEKEDLDIRVGDRTLATQITINRRSLGSSLELKKSISLSIPVGGAAVIDNLHLEQGDGVTEASRLLYNVLRHPQEGSLVLDSSNSQLHQLSVRTFSQQDIDLGRLQYVHGASGAGRDSFQLNITSPHLSKGPYSFYIDIYEHHVSLLTDQLTVLAGSSMVVSGTVINVTSSDRDDYTVRIVTQPNYGWIVKDNWSVANISSINSFTGADLRERRVIYVSDNSQTATQDQFGVEACISSETCTPEKFVDVLLTRRNIQSPQLLRNELLRVSGEKALITNLHLDTEDPDSPADSVFFLISRPSNGIVVHVHQMERAIYNFSQKEIDDNSVVFVKNSNATGSGGFSFLLSDGVHQIGPEWFSIESWSSSSPLLETNSRLHAPPTSTTIIGVELLRANLPEVHPEQALFSITRPPRHGQILVDGRKAEKFSQNDINRKMVWYSSVGQPQKEWTRKDSFAFVISRNGSAQPVDQEFRFRISSTYAALSDDIDKYVSTSPLLLSRGGSSALNKSHINLDNLMSSIEKEVLLIEIGKSPRHGSLAWLDGTKEAVSLVEFMRGITAVYIHDGEETSTDSIMFFVYPISETTKRSSRLRITIPLTIDSLRDPLVQVQRFASTLTVMNAGSTEITSNSFLASHPHVPPQSIVFEVIQSGMIGVSVRVGGVEKRLFSQEQVNKGMVTIVHTPIPTAASSLDVLVFSVEGHSRALVVKIRPLDLALENHTVIEYPQGKTYVVLNRSHLGAYSNGDRSKISYKVTSGPTNGTFYWVAGEKEAKQFTQADIDDGKVLYAQLNMHSYQDSFEFLLGNSERDMVRNRSEIKVRSLVEVQPVIVETDTSTPLTASQLNATMLQGSTPRFLVTAPPKYGRISLDPTTNHSALFFTYPDILRGRVYYQAFSTTEEVTEKLELEVRADSVQPARIILSITILPDDRDAEELKEIEEKKHGQYMPADVPRLVPINDQIPVIILIVIMIITVLVVICLNRKKKTKEQPVPPTPPRLPPTPSDSTSQEKSDLLGSTVFASVGRSETRPPMKTFERPANTMTPASKRRHQPSLDYAGLTSDTPPLMPLFKQISAPHSDTQYWV